MRTYMVIPTYWSGPEGTWREGDAVYDHATPINEEGTLERTLQSIHRLNDHNFTLIIIATVTNLDYLEEMYEKVKSIIEEVNLPVDTLLFTHKNMSELKNALYKNIEIEDILHLDGYSNIRNLCIFLPYILDAEVAILIDDDEIFEDADFVTKAKEFIGRRLYGNTVDGVAGYYLNEDNNYYDKVDMEPWMTYWDRFGGKREAFDKIIGSEPRLKKTPFAFGGVMVIHRNLLRIVPFDPEITRGEDTDYVINARVFGFNFYLDRTLAIKHLPPPKNHPVWKRFREDIYRFLYDKSKFETQIQKPNLHYLEPEDFDPYPGQFMKADLEDKIFKTNIILALNYLTNNDVKACKETIRNIYLAKYEAVPHYNTFKKYLKFQKNWRKLLNHTKGFGNALKDLILKSRIVRHDKYQIYKKKLLSSTKLKDYEFKDIDLFKPFSKKELRKLFYISEIKEYDTNDFIFKVGDRHRCVYVVLEGVLSIIKHDKISGDEIIIAEIKQGDHFNETSIFFDEKHGVSVQAKSEVSLLQIERKKLVELIKDNAPLSTKILWIISRKLSERLMATTKKFSETKEKSSDLSDLIND